MSHAHSCPDCVLVTAPPFTFNETYSIGRACALVNECFVTTIFCLFKFSFLFHWSSLSIDLTPFRCFFLFLYFIWFSSLFFLHYKALLFFDLTRFLSFFLYNGCLYCHELLAFERKEWFAFLYRTVVLYFLFYFFLLIHVPFFSFFFFVIGLVIWNDGASKKKERNQGKGK